MGGGGVLTVEKVHARKTKATENTDISISKFHGRKLRSYNSCVTTVEVRFLGDEPSATM